jgi:hypothetical protein
MQNKLIWYQLTLAGQKLFDNLLDRFKSLFKEIEVRTGENAIYFPTNSYPNDYSKIYISKSPEENSLFMELLNEFDAQELSDKPKEGISKVISDKDILYYGNNTSFYP